MLKRRYESPYAREVRLEDDEHLIGRAKMLQE